MKNLTKALWASALAFLMMGCTATQQHRETEKHDEKALAKEEKKEDRMLSTDVREDYVMLVKKAPAEAVVGETFMNTLTVTAREDVADVIVTDSVPTGATLERSEPAAKVTGSTLAWTFPSLKKGESKQIMVYMKTDKEGEYSSCCSVSATRLHCVKTIVGRAAIVLSKTGPATAQLGAEITYSITVSNTGNAIAREIVVTDTVPNGLSHASGNKTLSFPVGDLAPKQARTIPVTFKTTQRGRVCNPAVATSSNAGKVNAEACTVITQPGVQIVKTGDKRQFLTRNANYTITVTNTGDTPLTGVVVTDSAASALRLVSATGASVSGNNATWTVGDLAAGQARSFNVVATSTTPGNHCNAATVRTAQGPTGTSEACTLWEGVPAILIEVLDEPDPIQVGEQTTFTIRVTNQGTADDTNVGVTANFQQEVTPVSADSGGTISGSSVKWPTVPRLGAKQVLTYKVVGKGAVAGDHRLKIQLTSDALKTPVTEEESTRVY